MRFNSRFTSVGTHGFMEVFLSVLRSQASLMGKILPPIGQPGDFSFLEVVMTFYVDAWLDRNDPYIDVRHRLTNAVVAHFDQQQLQQCLDEGDISLQDLLDTAPESQQEVIRTLLLCRVKAA